MKRFAVISLLLLFLGGCAMDQDRREKYVQDTPQLTEEVRASILRGEIRRGMTEEEVRASWGRPWEMTDQAYRGISSTTWRYGAHTYEGGLRTSPSYVYFDGGLVVGWEVER